MKEFSKTVEGILAQYTIDNEYDSQVIAELDRLFDSVDEEKKQFVKVEKLIQHTYIDNGVVNDHLASIDKEGNLVNHSVNFLSKHGDYLLERFRSTANSELKVKYGIILYYLVKVKNQTISRSVIDTCLLLLKRTENGNSKWVFGTYIEVSLLFSEIVKYREDEVFQYFIKALLDTKTFRSTLIEFFLERKSSKDKLKLNEVLRVIESAFDKKKNELNYIFSYRICELGLKVSTMLGNAEDMKLWQKKWGLNLFQMGLEREKVESVETNPTYLASYTFLHDSLEIIRKSGDKDLLEKATLEYQRVKGKIALHSVRLDLSETETTEIINHISSLTEKLSKLDENDLLNYLSISEAFLPRMYKTFGDRNQFLDQVSTYRINHFNNNAIKDGIEDKDILLKKLFQNYHYEMQMYHRVLMMRLALICVGKGKLSENGVISHLMKSWLGVSLAHNIHGENYPYNWVGLLMPSIVELYKQLTIEFLTEERGNFILAIDSMVIKFEGLIRDFARLNGVGVTRSNRNKTVERTLEDLISDDKVRAKIGEENYMYFMYLYSADYGLNIRNHVAHGLYKSYDYNQYYALLVLFSILRMANYEIKAK